MGVGAIGELLAFPAYHQRPAHLKLPEPEPLPFHFLFGHPKINFKLGSLETLDPLAKSVLGLHQRPPLPLYFTEQLLNFQLESIPQVRLSLILKKIPDLLVFTLVDLLHIELDFLLLQLF